MKPQIDRTIYGMRWPADPTEAPIFQIPSHLQRTVLGLQLLQEHATENRRDTAKTVLENAIAAIAWMCEQTEVMINCAEHIKIIDTDQGPLSLTELARKVSNG